MQSKKKDNVGITALYCRLSRDDGTVEVCSRIAVIHITASVGEAVFFCVFLQQFLLIGDGIAVVISAVITGQAAV